MIINEKHQDAFTATEDLLLVPVPDSRKPDLQGFAGKVFSRFPLAEVRLNEHGGLKLGETLLVGHYGSEAHWVPPYSLALCALHKRMSRGWEEAPKLLSDAFDDMMAATYQKENVTLAVAGTPGSGYSGLLGNAPIEAIQEVMESHPIRITLYRDDVAGDRAKLLTADPTLDDAGSIV